MSHPVANLPVYDVDQNIEIYLLEASFPDTTPNNIKSAAGLQFDYFIPTFGAIGIWNKAKDEKFAIEFRANDYIGSLLPYIMENNSSLYWNNSAQILFTMPFDESLWISSILVNKISFAQFFLI